MRRGELEVRKARHAHKLLAAQPERFGACAHEDLIIFRALGHEGIGADEAALANFHTVADGAVHSEEGAGTHSDHA